MKSVEEREAQKARWIKYREAAQRLHPDVKVSPHGSVSEDAERSGAFVDVVVWVPRTEIEET